MSAWASSWGTSWSGAWGDVGVTPPATPPEEGLDTSGDETSYMTDDELFGIGIALVTAGILDG